MAWRKKGKKDAPVVQMSEEEVQAIEEQVAELVHTQLPIGRVKKVVRMNPDVEMLNNEALQLMAKSAELFIKELSNAANEYALMEKRKTLQTKDIDKVIKKTWQFAFLEDALDGWPKFEPKKRKPGATASQEDSILEETVVEDQEDQDEVENPEDHEEEQADETEDQENQEDDEELPETVPEIDENDEFGEKDVDQRSPMKDPFAEQF